jgi:hypothetical protein
MLSVQINAQNVNQGVGIETRNRQVESLNSTSMSCLVITCFLDGQRMMRAIKG